MDPDTREPVRYRAADGAAIVVILLLLGAIGTGLVLRISALALPDGLRALSVLAVVAAAGYCALWALCAGTVLEPAGLRQTSALRTRTVPWSAVDAVHTAHPVAVLADGTWLPLHPGDDAGVQAAVVQEWWLQHRGPGWRPPTTIPPYAAGERAARPRVPLRGWWKPAAVVTAVIGLPLALAAGDDLRTGVSIVGAVFVGQAGTTILGDLGSARRYGVPVPAARRAVAFGVVALVVVLSVLAWIV